MDCTTPCGTLEYMNSPFLSQKLDFHPLGFFSKPIGSPAVPKPDNPAPALLVSG